MKRKILTTITAAALTLASPFTGLSTGIPVFDASNLTQNLLSALNSVRHTIQQTAAYAQQVQQYQLQLQQYKNMLLNTTGLAQAAQAWQSAQQTMSELQSLYGQFSSPSQLMAQLNQYQNVQYWASINTSAYQPQTAGSDAQKKADDAWVKSLAAQQQLLQQDAANLQRLQTTASNTQGQVQAIEAASQIAAQTNEQLMEIRALMISEQNALVARQQTLANDEAMKQAASDKFLGVGTQYQPAPEEVLKAP